MNSNFAVWKEGHVGNWNVNKTTVGFSFVVYWCSGTSLQLCLSWLLNKYKYSTQPTHLGCDSQNGTNLLKGPCLAQSGSSSSKHLEPYWQFSQRPRALVILPIIYIDRLKLCSHLYSFAPRLSKMNLQSWKHSSLISPSCWFLVFSNNCGVWDRLNTVHSGSPSILICFTAHHSAFSELSTQTIRGTLQYCWKSRIWS